MSFEIPADRLLHELLGSNRPAFPHLAQDDLLISARYEFVYYQTFLKMLLTPSRTPSTIESWV